MQIRALVSDPIDIPNEPGQWVKLRRLGRTRMRAAATAYLVGAVTRINDMGGPEALKVLRSMKEDANPLKDTLKEETEKADADPLNSFDEDTLLNAGVESWSYTDATGAIAPVNAETLDQVSANTAKWMARTIVAFSRGELDEAARKKD